MTVLLLLAICGVCSFAIGFVSGKACERLRQDGIGEADEYKVGGSE